MKSLLLASCAFVAVALSACGGGGGGGGTAAQPCVNYQSQGYQNIGNNSYRDPYNPQNVVTCSPNSALYGNQNFNNLNFNNINGIQPFGGDQACAAYNGGSGWVVVGTPNGLVCVRQVLIPPTIQPAYFQGPSNNIPVYQTCAFGGCNRCGLGGSIGAAFNVPGLSASLNFCGGGY